VAFNLLNTSIDAELAPLQAVALPKRCCEWLIANTYHIAYP
jgi:hypothetical protein